MKIGLVIYGELDTLSGGYLYDRKLVEHLRSCGDTVEILSLPWRNYFAHLTDNLHFRFTADLDLLIQDELNHPSLITANRKPNPFPVISLVHHLRISEQFPAWQKAIFKFVEKRYLESVDGYIFNSETTKGVVEGLVGEAKPNIVAFPPTDSHDSEMTAQQIERRAAQTGLFRIIFVGNLIPRKGLDTLLRAVNNLRFGVHVDVVGSLDMDARYALQMKRLAAIAHPQSRIMFHGPLRDQDLSALFGSADVLVVPSLYEGFGIVYLEGMGFGLPAIGTNQGAAGEIIAEGETGFLISPGDAERLAGYLERLATNKGELLRMSLNAFHRYQLQPSWSDTADRIREFLSQQINSFSAARQVE